VFEKDKIMFICGIIAEYNPFHRGHERHIALTRESSDALIICAMSDSFVQRGEPAIFDKWTRAACALKCGADAVIELPLLYAIQSAEGFATGGVNTLAAAGMTHLSFGCETDDLSLLKRMAATLSDENKAYKDALKAHLSKGQSFPRARMSAADAPEVASMPGALLGIEYIKAINAYHPHITPHVIKREGAAYHSADISEYLPSATAIRAAFAAGDTQKALDAMPDACAEYLRAQINAGLKPAFADAFDNALLTTLRLKGREYIATLPDVSEGLENRIYDAALKCATRSELIARIKTKRYTYARISRILLCALLGITRDMIEEANTAPVSHIHVLGAKSPDVLSKLAAASKVPLVTTAAPPYPDIDIAASGVWALTQSASPFCDADRDYTQRLLVGE
jgi:predicted nucleotidyltransferase